MGLLGLRGVAEIVGDVVGFCGDAGGTGVGLGVADATGEVCVGLVVAVAVGGSGMGVGVAGEVPTCCVSTAA